MESSLKNLKRLFAVSVTSDALECLLLKKRLHHTKSSETLLTYNANGFKFNIKYYLFCSID